MIDASGTIYRGGWRDGKLHGPTVVELTGGGRREVMFEIGIMHGRGMYTDTDGVSYSELWDNGECIAQRELSPPPQDDCVSVRSDSASYLDSVPGSGHQTPDNPQRTPGDSTPPRRSGAGGFETSRASPAVAREPSVRSLCVALVVAADPGAD
jgi:hypothetical protein